VNYFLVTLHWTSPVISWKAGKPVPPAYYFYCVVCYYRVALQLQEAGGGGTGGEGGEKGVLKKIEGD